MSLGAHHKFHNFLLMMEHDIGSVLPVV